jgi:hypothetical protein
MSLDHTEAVLARKQEIDQELEESHLLQEQSHHESHSQAKATRQKSLEKKSQNAHHYSSEDITQVRARKELYDALDESEKHGKAHELRLKAELSEANRVDFLHAIQEKQKNLQ